MSRRTGRRRAEASYGPQVGTTYLLHFIDPATGEPARYKHAGHYTGWTTDLAARLDAHARGKGARLIEVITRAGLGFTLARTWPHTTRDREDLLKHIGDARRFCPECGVTPRQQPAVVMPERRRSLYELERDGTWLDGTPLPETTTYPTTAAGHTVSREENQMFGRQRRTAARLEAAQQAEADRLFALADELDRQAGERPDYRREITAERAARIRRELGKDLAGQAAAQAAEPALQGARLDAEVDRLAEMFPEPEPDPDVPAGYIDAIGEPYPAPDWIPQPDGVSSAAWDRYYASEPGSGEHKAAYVDMHREANGAGFPGTDPDQSYLADHGYETDADWFRRAEPEPGAEAAPDYHRSAPGSAEHRAAYTQMHAEAGGAGFAHPDPDVSYEIDNAGELAAERYYEEMAERHYREVYGDIEAEEQADREYEDQAEAEQAKLGPDAHRWPPEMDTPAAPAHFEPSPTQAEEAKALRGIAGYDRLRAPGRYDQAVVDNEAGAPDHLYGAPDCAEADPETAHFGSFSPEAQDAGRWPLPRVLEPGEVSGIRAPVAATLPDGTPHADPFLAGRGWQTRGGLYVRQPQAQLEAG